MRLFKLVSLIVLVALVLVGCAQPTAAPAPAAPAAKAEPTKAPAAAAPTKAPAAAAPTGGDLKVAVLAPLSGSVPTFGVMTRDGALLAIEEWNAKGGVNGKKIVPTPAPLGALLPSDGAVTLVVVAIGWVSSTVTGLSQVRSLPAALSR